MARPAKESTAPDVAPDAPPKMVLKKNHGLLIEGRTSKFYPAGTEFELETDADLIAKLIQTGAQFE